MSLDTQALFQPLQLGPVTLANRVVMAPMTRSFSPGGVPGADVAAYYRRRAEGGVGLLLSEGTVVDRSGSSNDPRVPRFHGDQALAGWKGVVDAVHAAGGRMGPQIWHVGAAPTGSAAWTTPELQESPSGLFKADQHLGRTMQKPDIDATIAAFVQAAKDTVALGFDVVEIHAAHGYLLDQFFWSATNHRADEWGGRTLAERSRLTVEIVRAVRAAVGPTFPIFLRLSQWKVQEVTARLAESPAEMEAWLRPLVEAGADVLDCSQRRFWEPEFPEVDGPEGLNFAGWAKKLTGALTMSVGSVGLTGDVMGSFSGEGSQSSSLDRLVRRMEKGEFDLIAVGRALLNDPQWLAKVRAGDASQLRPFTAEAFATLS